MGLLTRPLEVFEWIHESHAQTYEGDIQFSQWRVFTSQRKEFSRADIQKAYIDVRNKHKGYIMWFKVNYLGTENGNYVYECYSLMHGSILTEIAVLAIIATLVTCMFLIAVKVVGTEMKKIGVPFFIKKGGLFDLIKDVIEQTAMMFKWAMWLGIAYLAIYAIKE